MKPRGLMVIHNFPPGPSGGAELQAERLSAQLVDLGHSMQALTWLTKPDAPLEETCHGVQIHRVNHRLAYYVKQDVTNTFRYLMRHRHSYDVLHVHMAYGHAVVAVVVARCFGKKCIIKIACAGEFGDLYNFSKFDGFSRALQILYQADAIVAVSLEVEQELLRYGFSPTRIVHIPNGVDTQYFKRNCLFPESNKVRFVLIGRRHPQKGIDTTLQAAKLLQNEGMGNHFEIKLYGEDYPEHNYQNMARQLGLTKVVKFFPFERDILPVYRSAHCLLLPSRGEGLPNSLLEAMAMELAVIVSRVSGTTEVVDDGENGVLIPSDSPEALARAMALIIQNPDQALRFGRSARHKVTSRFSLDSVARQYSNLYHLVCGNNIPRKYKVGDKMQQKDDTPWPIETRRQKQKEIQLQFTPIQPESKVWVSEPLTSIQAEMGFAYFAPTRHPELSSHKHPSPACVLENGMPLPGLGNALHDDIRQVGRGRYSFWHDRVYFSTSDNSDPCTNGRHYKISYPPAGICSGVARLFYVVTSPFSIRTLCRWLRLVLDFGKRMVFLVLQRTKMLPNAFWTMAYWSLFAWVLLRGRGKVK
jgi:glycosyltransferase involved in cell wall biosynthesis